MKNKITKFKHIKPVSYTLFFLIIFVLFLFVTFPGEVIKKRIVSEIENNTPYRADIETVDVSPLLKVNLKGVKLYKADALFIELESVDVSPSLFTVFSDSPRFPFTARLWGGEVDGSIRLNKSSGALSEIDATVKRVNINSIPSLLSPDSKDAVKLAGLMDGEVHLVMTPQAKGSMSFEIEGLKLEDIKLKGFSLPSLTDLKSVFRGNVDGGITKIEEFTVFGPEIDLDITGTAPLLWEIKRGGVIDIGYSLQMKGGQMAKYKGLLAPYLVTQRDGSLGGKILGTVSNPRFEKGSVKKF